MTEYKEICEYIEKGYIFSDILAGKLALCEKSQISEVRADFIVYSFDMKSNSFIKEKKKHRHNSNKCFIIDKEDVKDICLLFFERKLYHFFPRGILEDSFKYNFIPYFREEEEEEEEDKDKDKPYHYYKDRSKRGIVLPYNFLPDLVFAHEIIISYATPSMYEILSDQS